MRRTILVVIGLAMAVCARAGIQHRLTVIEASKENVTTLPVLLTVIGGDKDTLSLKAELKRPFGVRGTFTRFELRVLGSTATGAAIKKTFYDSTALRKQIPKTSEVAEYSLDRAEIERTYLVITARIEDQDSMPAFESTCLPLAPLLRLRN